jgi:Uma2 family endonuclease
MATVGHQPATLDDLCRTEGKAELIGGRIVPLMVTGHRPNEIAGNIYVSLRAHAKLTKRGHAYTDNMGYAVPKLPSGRESFSPDASFYDGPLPANPMRLIQGPPTFAVEVRSENDYGPAAEVELADKREEYFTVGTLAVWDVDPIAQTINVYGSAAPQQSVILRQGDTADAEPAVPGWPMPLSEVFA